MNLATLSMETKKPTTGIERNKTFIKVWLDGDVRIDGFALIPQGIREQDFLELNNKKMLALTDCMMYTPNGSSEHKVILLNRNFIRMVIPQ